MVTMTPFLRSSMVGRKALMPRNAPRTLTAKMRSHSSTVCSKTGFVVKAAALFTRMSTSPRVSCTTSVKMFHTDGISDVRCHKEGCATL